MLRIILIVLLGALHTFADSSDFDPYFSNLRSHSFSDYGTIGLLHMPTARMMPAGSLSFHWSGVQPYLRGSIVTTPFSRFEALYKYTDINTELYSNVKEFSGGQSLKDKAFDFKFILLKESDYLPQIAFGIRDFGGTDRFAAEYFAFSKYYKNFDFTFGIGWGTLAGTRSDSRFKNPLIDLSDKFRTRGQSGRKGTGGGVSEDNFFSGAYASYFGGLEYFFPNRKISFKFEFDPTDYMIEGDRGNPLEQDSNLNFGIVFNPSKRINYHLGWVRGNTLQLGFSFKGLYGPKDPLKLKKKFNKKVDNAEVWKKVNELDDKYIYRTSFRELRDIGLWVQSANIEDGELQIAYGTSEQQSYVRAAGQASNVLDQIMPEKINRFSFTYVNAGSEMHTLSIPRDTFAENLASNNYQEVKYYSEITKADFDLRDNEFVPPLVNPLSKFAITPALKSHIGGPDGFYFGEIFLKGDHKLLFNRKFSLHTVAEYKLTGSFGSLKLASDSVLPHVRTDIIEYLKQGENKLRISRSQFTYLDEPFKNVYTKVAAGAFEEMFAGVGGEILYRPFYSNHAIGAEIYRVKQRAYDQRFDFLDYQTTTGHINYFYRHPKTNVLFQMSGGRFLAGDSGITFDFSRRFKSGFYLGAFFTLTDVSKQEFGEGSFDKGFYFSLPLEIFYPSYSTGRQYFGLRPITRDGGARLITAYTLFGVTDMNNFHTVNRDWDDLYD